MVGVPKLQESTLRHWLLAIFAVSCLAQCEEPLTISSTRHTLEVSLEGQAQKCEWVFEPQASRISRVEVVLTSIFMAASELHVYGDSQVLNADTLRWSCISCSRTVPPPIIGETGFRIVYISSRREGFTRQFTASFFTIHMDLAMDAPVLQELSVPYARLQAPTVDGIFPRDLQWTWTITLPSESNPPTVLVLEEFWTESCDAELTVVEGDLDSPGILLSSWCGEGLTARDFLWVNTSASVFSVLVRVSGAGGVAGGFTLTYAADSNLYECGGISGFLELRGTSQFLTDGTRSDLPLRTGEVCAWLIIPAINTSLPIEIVAVFERLSMKEGSILEIYEGYDTRAPLLWHCNGCGSTAPPVLVSHASAMYLRHSSDIVPSAAFRGFKLKYLTRAANLDADNGGMGDGIVPLIMSTATVTPVTAVPGIRTTWAIEPATTVGPVTLSFVNLSLPDCSKPLRVFDGLGANAPSLGVFCGFDITRTWVTSTGTAMRLEKETAGPNALTAFSLEYFSEGNNYQCGVDLFQSPSFWFSDGSATEAVMTPGLNCVWRIHPVVEASAIVFVFERLSLEGARLRIFAENSDDPVYVTNDGSGVPPIIRVPTAVARVEFEVDDDADDLGTGFALRYYSDHTASPGFGDNTTPLYAAAGQIVAIGNSVALPADHRYQWVVSPPDARDILLYVVNLTWPSCSNVLDVFDGVEYHAPRLARLCNTTSFTAVVARSGRLVVHMETQNVESSGVFEMDYFSAGRQNACGYVGAQGYLRARFFLLSDGSASHSRSLDAKECQWVINPSFLAPNEIILVTFDYLELSDSSLEIEAPDITPSENALHWQCKNCSSVPPAILASGPISLKLDVPSQQDALGFRLRYEVVSRDAILDEEMNSRFVLVASSLRRENVATPQADGVWRIPAGAATARLFVNTSTTPQRIGSLDSDFDTLLNGTSLSRDSNSSLSEATFTFCGDVEGPTSFPVYEGTDSVLPAQTGQQAILPDLSLFTTSASVVSEDNVESNDVMVVASQQCSWVFTGGTSRGVVVLRILEGTRIGPGSSLSAFEGSSVRGLPLLALSGPAQVTTSFEISSGCGELLLRLSRNTNDTMSEDTVDVSSYTEDGQEADTCRTADWEEPSDGREGVLLVLVSVLAACAVLFGAGSAYWYHEQRSMASAGPGLVRRGSNRNNGFASHPHHSPIVDAVRNAMLPVGECCICYGEVKCLTLPCSHGLCVEDFRSYLVTALGDAAMFPLRCPMHHAGCSTTIEPIMAKRVLSKSEYERFITFHNRAVFGDGLDCIFCGNFVNLPAGTVGTPMVECPYCRQRFCMNCRCLWHIGITCDEREDDGELEEWRRMKGATRCPVCKKIIEKSDSETCNHMVHKATDAIPCVRDRTDFCYCCGMEVLPNYPHDEVENPGVNHFPDGVFQECRIVKEGLLEVEQSKDERRRRRREMRDQNRRFGPAPIVPIDVGEGQNGRDNSDELSAVATRRRSGATRSPRSPRSASHRRRRTSHRPSAS